MGQNIQAAIERIKELDALIDDQQILIDLLYEDIADRDTLIRSLTGQLWNLRLDRRYEVSVA